MHGTVLLGMVVLQFNYTTFGGSVPFYLQIFSGFIGGYGELGCGKFEHLI